MGSYRPDYTDDMDGHVGSKRRKTGGDEFTQRYRSRSPQRSDQKSSKQSHRPYRDHEKSHNAKPYRQRDEYDSYRAQKSRDRCPQQNEDSSDRKTKRKTKTDRKENPSTRIHSLRRLIERKTLPPPVQAEKERELAALLFEQEQTAQRKVKRKNLSRYHFVRFVERQKAERVLKRLQKLKDSGITQTDQGHDIDQVIRTATVDLNYTIYAPLGEKYISIFAEHDRQGQPINKAAKFSNHKQWKLMDESEMKLLNAEQKDALQTASLEAAELLEMNIKPSNFPDLDGQIPKPPTWYEVEEAMNDGQSKLDSLRDRQKIPGSHAKERNLVVGLKAGKKAKMDWLHDNGSIDTNDLDDDDDNSEPKENGGLDGGVKFNKVIKNQNDSDEDMSDGDGGFFEKR